MLTPTDLAWLAGAFDGEGCVGLYKRLINGKPNGWCYFVTLSNSDPMFISRAYRLICEICASGPKRTQPYLRHDKSRGGRRPCFNVVCQNKSASEKFLQAIRPYLVNKGEQADAMLTALSCKGSDAHGVDNSLLQALSDRIKAMKAPYGDAEVMLQGLRSEAHRNEYQVSPNNNPGTSARHADSMKGIA